MSIAAGRQSDSTLTEFRLEHFEGPLDLLLFFN